jgi:hypothetical protein
MPLNELWEGVIFDGIRKGTGDGPVFLTRHSGTSERRKHIIEEIFFERYFESLSASALACRSEG